MKTYIIKYNIEDEIEATSEEDALIFHLDNITERLSSMIKEIVEEKE